MNGRLDKAVLSCKYIEDILCKGTKHVDPIVEHSPSVKKAKEAQQLWL